MKAYNVPTTLTHLVLNEEELADLLYLLGNIATGCTLTPNAKQRASRVHKALAAIKETNDESNG